MNRGQFAYQVGRLARSNYDILFLALAARLGTHSFQRFSEAQDISDLGDVSLGTILGVSATISALYAIYGGAARLLSQYHSWKINRNADDYPLEFAESVVIDDKDGLNFLLDKTHASGKTRWGTFLKAHDDNGRAVIDDISDIEECRKQGLITQGKRGGSNLELFKGRDMGYDGYHHYHRDISPKLLGASNYAIELHDGISPDNWINLLTFNVPEGPEIIGFNRRCVYIPMGPSKQELIPATPKRIKAYLGLRDFL